MTTITEAAAAVHKQYELVSSMFDKNLESLAQRNVVLKKIRDDFIKVLGGFKSGLKPKLNKLATAKEGEVGDLADEVLSIVSKYGKALNFGGVKDLIEANAAVGNMSHSLHLKHLDKMVVAVKAVVARPGDKALRKELETLASNWSKAKTEAEKYVVTSTAAEVSTNETALVAIKKFQKSSPAYFAKTTLDKLGLIDKAPNAGAAKELAGKLKTVTAALYKESTNAAKALNIEPSLKLEVLCKALHELTTQKAGG